MCICMKWVNPMLTLLHLPWIIEQPSSSLLEHHPRFKWICGRTKVWKAGCRYARPILVGVYLDGELRWGECLDSS